MTPEGKVKREISRELKRIGSLYSHMPVMNGMGAPTLDYVCCLRGRYFVIEAKAPGKWLTPIQQQTCQKISDAGGSWFCIDGSEESFNEFRLWVASIP